MFRLVPEIEADRKVGIKSGDPVIFAKFAVTKIFPFMVMRQVDKVPPHPPLHPVKSDPEAGAEIRATTAPLTNEAEQVAPQLMLVGEEVTVPEPVPAVVNVKIYGFEITVRVVFPLRVPEVAVIVVVPGFNAVAMPFVSIVATAMLLLFQTIEDADTILETSTGMVELAVVPFPNWP